MPSKPPIKPTSTWQTIALSSGVCAAMNAIFAKLTTASLTSSLSARTSSSLGLSSSQEMYPEVLLRAVIFGISFLFTGTMWALYTRALSLGPSAVHVNIVNTASNFIVTALLGAVVFGEKLPLLWWVGAAFLVGGSVIIGQREGVADETGEGDVEREKLKKDE